MFQFLIEESFQLIFISQLLAVPGPRGKSGGHAMPPSFTSEFTQCRIQVLSNTMTIIFGFSFFTLPMNRKLDAS